MTPVNIIEVDFSVITHSSMSFIFTGTPILVKCIAFIVCGQNIPELCFVYSKKLLIAIY